MSSVSQMFSEARVPETMIHGVLVELYRVGVLIVGDSGAGKSQCALDLIRRGHKLISDDAVEISKFGERLQGQSPECIRGLFEIRGLGIVKVRDMFGDSALAQSAEIGFRVDLVAPLQPPLEDMLALAFDSVTILGTSIPRYLLNTNSPRDIALSVETAARVFATRGNLTVGTKMQDSDLTKEFVTGNFS